MSMTVIIIKDFIYVCKIYELYILGSICIFMVLTCITIIAWKILSIGRRCGHISAIAAPIGIMLRLLVRRKLVIC